ncbi:MAG: AI-2E family transporter [Kiritimatiellae bacterium]|nr:AI-2E family transporter [Kiritimatiellia bacterium]MDD4736352.1 AI-2E family transporter [Kiritimatiellia bacterium]
MNKLPSDFSLRLLPVLRGIFFCLIFVAVILTGAVLRSAQSVFIPLIFAWILAQALSPLVRVFNRWKVPTSLMITVVLLLVMVLLYWLGLFISSSATAFAQQVPAYQTKLARMLADVVTNISHHFESLSTEEINQQISRQIGRLSGQLMLIISRLAGMITGLISDIVMIIIMLAFILIGQKYTASKIIHAFSSDTAARVVKMSQSISGNISSYLIIQTAISLVTGLFVGITCRLLGIPNAETWGALAFFLNFIPTIGSILASIPPILLALLQFYPNVWPALGAAILILVINQVLGNVITPKLMGDTLDLSPVVILLSLLFWGWLWGIPGAFLSVIILATLKIVAEQIEPLRPLAVFMSSGKHLPRTPEETKKEHASSETEKA